MKSPTVYFDTSVFIGLLDNMKGRQSTARDIVLYESGVKSKIHTSIMTVNEFISRTYDEYHDKPNLKEKVDEVIQSIRDVAEIQAFSQDVAKDIRHAAIRESENLATRIRVGGQIPEKPKACRFGRFVRRPR